MDWQTVKADGHKRVDGKKYDLSHLNDATYSITIEATKKCPETSFSLLVQYSSHCVSWGPKRNENIDFSHYGEDRRIVDEKGIHRCFCETRHELSLQLPDIFEEIVDKKCCFTGRENWLIVELLDPEGIRQEYEIYFNLAKQGKRFLRLYVESAYVRDPDAIDKRPAHLKKQDKIRAKVLFAKKLRGEAIRRPVG